MRALIWGIRSILFNIAFYGFTLIFCTFVLMPTILVKTERPARRGVYMYCATNIWLARVVMGIKTEYRGTDKLPKEGALILAAAHQSYMDPMLTYVLRPDTTALAKKELFSIPIIGPVLAKIGAIRIDRAAGTAHMGMDDVAQQMQDQERLIIVYPQGTRVPIGQHKALKSGAYFLAKAGGLPVYPVATNAGLFWTKGFWHRSGTAVFEIGDPIASVDDKGSFMAFLQEKVVNDSDKLIREAGFGDLLPASDS